jgi:hypothetical protein
VTSNSINKYPPSAKPLSTTSVSSAKFAPPLTSNLPPFSPTPSYHPGLTIATPFTTDSQTVPSTDSNASKTPSPVLSSHQSNVIITSHPFCNSSTGFPSINASHSRSQLSPSKPFSHINLTTFIAFSPVITRHGPFVLTSFTNSSSPELTLKLVAALFHSPHLPSGTLYLLTSVLLNLSTPSARPSRLIYSHPNPLPPAGPIT